MSHRLLISLSKVPQVRAHSFVDSQTSFISTTVILVRARLNRSSSGAYEQSQGVMRMLTAEGIEHKFFGQHFLQVRAHMDDLIRIRVWSQPKDGQTQFGSNWCIYQPVRNVLGTRNYELCSPARHLLPGSFQGHCQYLSLSVENHPTFLLRTDHALLDMPVNTVLNQLALFAKLLPELCKDRAAWALINIPGLETRNQHYFPSFTERTRRVS